MTIKFFLVCILLLDLISDNSAWQHATSSTRLFQAKPEVDVEVDIKIRDCKYAELNPVSDLVVNSFYDNKPNDVFKHMYRLAELSRLQQNFPYMDQQRHRMLVAISTAKDESRIVGFCDVDARTATPNIHYKCNPRPILSDVMVCPTMRRNGIGKKLVKNCERICLQDFNTSELYIRVLESNEAGIALYTGLGYNLFANPGDPPEVRLLKKELTSRSDD